MPQSVFGPYGAFQRPYKYPDLSAEGRKGNADEEITEILGDPASEAAGKLNDTIGEVGGGLFAPPTGVLQHMLGVIRGRVRDYRLLVIGDSTTEYSSPSSWLRLLPTALGSLFPHLTIELRMWDDATTAYVSTTTVTGATSQKLLIYGYAKGSQSFQYFTDETRRGAGFPVNMDSVWVALGHNENNPGMAADGGFGITAQRCMVKAALHLELYRAYAGNAPLLIMSQNAVTTDAGAPEQWANIYRRISADRGYGFLDIAQAFKTDPRGVAALLGDGLHPNAAGFALWRDTVIAALVGQDSSQMIPSAPPTITQPGLEGIAYFNNSTSTLLDVNNYLLTRDGSTKLPAGWVATNLTITEQDGSIPGEIGYRCLKLQKVDPNASARLEQFLNYKALRGKTITAGFRVRVPAGQANAVGRAEIQGDDGTGTSISFTSPDWGQFDQWIWRTATLRLPNGTSMVRRRIWVDPIGTDTDATLYLDRASLAVGYYPHESA